MADNNTLDKIMGKAGQMAESAVKTTTSLVNRGRDKAEEVSLQAKVAKLYRQLGSLVYALRKNDEENEPMIAWYISEIDRLQARMALLQTPTTPPSTPKTPKDDIFVYDASVLEEDEDAMFRDGSEF